MQQQPSILQQPPRAGTGQENEPVPVLRSSLHKGKNIPLHHAYKRGRGVTYAGLLITAKVSGPKYLYVTPPNDNGKVAGEAAKNIRVETEIEGAVAYAVLMRNIYGERAADEMAIRSHEEAQAEAKKKQADKTNQAKRLAPARPQPSQPSQPQPSRLRNRAAPRTTLGELGLSAIQGMPPKMRQGIAQHESLLNEEYRQRYALSVAQAQQRLHLAQNREQDLAEQEAQLEAQRAIVQHQRAVAAAARDAEKEALEQKKEALQQKEAEHAEARHNTEDFKAELEQERAAKAALAEELEQERAAKAALAEQLEQERAAKAALAEQLEEVSAAKAKLEVELERVRKLEDVHEEPDEGEVWYDSREGGASAPDPLNMTIYGEEKTWILTDVQLGKGAFGEVALVYDPSDTESEAAFKQPLNRSERDTVLNTELAVYEAIKRGGGHACILELLDKCMRDPKGLVLQLANSSLEDHIACYKADGTRMSETHAATISAQLVSAVSFLHRNSLVHRDLKPGNILFATDNTCIKVCDFGLSSIIENNRQARSKSFRGSMPYAAPEQHPTPDGEISYNMKHAELWSIGVIVYEMLTNERPFKSDDDSSWRASIEAALPLAPLGSALASRVWAGLLVSEPTARTALHELEDVVQEWLDGAAAEVA